MHTGLTDHFFHVNAARKIFSLLLGLCLGSGTIFICRCVFSRGLSFRVFKSIEGKSLILLENGIYKVLVPISCISEVYNVLRIRVKVSAIIIIILNWFLG